MKNKPAGVTLLVILFFALGTLSVVWGLLILGVSGLSAFFGSLFNAEGMQSFGNSTAWSGFFNIIAGIIQIVVGFGLLGMQKWAWYVAVAGIALGIIQGVIGLFGGGTFGFICGSLWLVVPIAALVYLLTRGLRKAYHVNKIIPG
jgi:hypothetical protein